ncbi:hypothetical protein L873DRAFT_1801083 [Choiromyces venosus 120613-1]|uniref:Uncharacterized protein n=1 Tax=Choiromyces venosus 120613-1 TaxID=1336337 RepID=A0A3N4KAQ6_9PEZI|nr:hypothetical protein L873DRAFT_1801083 [Choiromyces venosus 120613-1]
MKNIANRVIYHGGLTCIVVKCQNSVTNGHSGIDGSHLGQWNRNRVAAVMEMCKGDRRQSREMVIGTKE